MKTSSPSFVDTYNGWKERGFQVQRGSKAVGYQKMPSRLGKKYFVCVSVFTRKQVKPISTKTRSWQGNHEGWDYEGSWEELISEEDMTGIHD